MELGALCMTEESEAKDDIIHQHPLKWHSGRTGFNIIIYIAVASTIITIIFLVNNRVE